MANARYPELYRKFYRNKRAFERGVDRKSRHYELLADLVPNALIATYESVRETPWDSLPERFVIKADVGTNTTRVKCLERTGDDLYVDHLHPRAKHFSRSDLESFFEDKGRVLIERFLHDPNQGTIPWDIKIYVAYDEVLYIRVVDRNGSGRDVAIFDSALRRVPHLEFFLPDNDKIDESGPIELPGAGMRSAMNLATEIGTRLMASFVSVDLYVINENEIYLGELTWAPGPLVYEPMQPKTVRHILETIERKERDLAEIEGSLIWKANR